MHKTLLQKVHKCSSVEGDSSFFVEIGWQQLELHLEETRIVYCKDEDRTLTRSLIMSFALARQKIDSVLISVDRSTSAVID